MLTPVDPRISATQCGAQTFQTLLLVFLPGREVGWEQSVLQEGAPGLGAPRNSVHEPCPGKPPSSGPSLPHQYHVCLCVHVCTHVGTRVCMYMCVLNEVR